MATTNVYYADAWDSWNDGYTSTTASSRDYIWTYWSGTSSTSSTTYTSTTETWSNWIAVYETTTGRLVRHVEPPPQQILTAEQIRAQDERMAQYRREAAARQAERDKAIETARRLLMENLTPEQLEQFKRDQSFVVVGRNHRRFRIREGRSANVDVINPDGRISHRLCAHPQEQVPDFDTMLAQKLMLEHDDEHFMRLANHHERRYGDGDRAVLPALRH